MVKRFGAERLVVESGVPDHAMGAVILAVIDAAITDGELEAIIRRKLGIRELTFSIAEKSLDARRIPPHNEPARDDR